MSVFEANLILNMDGFSSLCFINNRSILFWTCYASTIWLLVSEHGAEILYFYGISDIILKNYVIFIVFNNFFSFNNPMMLFLHFIYKSSRYSRTFFPLAAFTIFLVLPVLQNHCNHIKCL